MGLKSCHLGTEEETNGWVKPADRKTRGGEVTAKGEEVTLITAFWYYFPQDWSTSITTGILLKYQNLLL